jgi:hypothetical protein
MANCVLAALIVCWGIKSGIKVACFTSLFGVVSLLSFCRLFAPAHFSVFWVGMNVYILSDGFS